MPNGPEWQILIPNRLPDLIRAIGELDHRLEAWGADADARYLCQFAAEELGTNIIKYAYDDSHEHSIRLSATRDEQGFRVVLEDDGHAFDPCLAPEPNPRGTLQERLPGGLGLSLVRRLAARMEYRREGNRNVVSVLVRRPPPPHQRPRPEPPPNPTDQRSVA